MSKAKRRMENAVRRIVAPKSRFEQLPDWVSPEEGRLYLGLSRSTMYELLRDGKIPSKPYGRRKLIPRDALKPTA